ncbi:Fpg/Nei family DNA glycosylase [Pseudactinotalea sp. HY158]|uniref:Fpg/Nei family DNA glycosylase n=1 Tax=Pseudactinotalea sp. HY158 TaxID=2654547 RepID=UPI00129C33EF|nr:DNA-formamidopyrimidine glycosylase family protein [Pseudactinotalea sp. HY158]QGH69862.1 Fpg/Nei family DNA glycosylase [Pseudactinotalea sp. HY158]
MPEGDVLRRVARRLEEALAGRVLVRGELRWPTLGARDLAGAGVTECVSYGKHLLLRLDDGRTLHTHLRMDGSWHVRRTADPPQRLGNADIRVVLANARWTCIGTLLGMCDLVPTAGEGSLLGHLGPDLLDPRVDLADVARRARREGDRPIGEVLLDQRVAAGIGTIYLAESLWVCRINPWRPVSAVPGLDRLYATAAALMRRSADAPALTATGSTRPGEMTHVHGRAGRPCRRCGAPIAVAGVRPSTVAAEAARALPDRPGYYCPACQPD